ncbi:HD-GYP domain-containing protein [Fusibacter sp. JL298sf-3]
MKTSKLSWLLFGILAVPGMLFWSVLAIFQWTLWTTKERTVFVLAFFVYFIISYYLYYVWSVWSNRKRSASEPIHQATAGLVDDSCTHDFLEKLPESNARERLVKIGKAHRFFEQTQFKFSKDFEYLRNCYDAKSLQLQETTAELEKTLEKTKEKVAENRLVMTRVYDPMALLDEKEQVVWSNDRFKYNFIELVESGVIPPDKIEHRLSYEGRQLVVLKDKALRLTKAEDLKLSKDVHFKHITQRNLDLKGSIGIDFLIGKILESIDEILGLDAYDLHFIKSDRTLVRRALKQVSIYQNADEAFTPMMYLNDDWIKHPRLVFIDYRERGLKSLVIAPLEVDGRLVAVYSLFLRSRLKEADKQTIKLFNNQFTMVVQRAVIYDTLRNQYFNTIQALVNVIEAKDKYTEGHSRRVSRFAVEIAKKMGYSNEEVERIEISGLLHDVGKIGIQQSILVKEGKLTQEEYEEMKLHPEKAIQILEAIDLETDIMDGILYHHLRYDLKGYPKVRLDRLPEFASIIGAADAFDAITSARSYSGKRSIEEAVRELERFSGSQFDPKIVEVMLKLIQENRERVELIIEDYAVEKRDIKGEYDVISGAL